MLKIPHDWELVKISDVGELEYGYTSAATAKNTGTKFLRISDIKDYGKVDWKSVPYCDVDRNNYEKYKLAPGDILFARIGATTGKAAYVDRQIRAVFAWYLIKFKPLLKELETKFLYYVTQSNSYWIQVHKNKEGQLKKGLNAKVLGNIEFVLPPLLEQKKIAEILSTVDQAIEKVDEAIEKTQRLKKGLMQELFTKGIGHEEFKDTGMGSLPKEWSEQVLSDVVYINKESIELARDFPEDRFHYIDINSVENETGFIREPMEILGKNAPLRARRVIHTSDVIMSTVRPYLKAFAIIPAKYDSQICSTGFAVLTSKKRILPYYLFQVLFSKRLISQCIRMMVGAQYPALNSSQVASLKIPLPNIKEQQKIAEILGTVDKRLGGLRNRKEKLEKLKKGLMEDLLTGRKRVKLGT